MENATGPALDGTLAPLLRVLAGERLERPPVWIMRQAGRYLPEYRQTREKAGSFLDLCYTPHLAAEVSLQPLRRFDLDAAIVFSDILVVPDALGRSVRFATGEGPILEPIDVAGIARLDPEGVVERLGPVMETLGLLRSALPRDKALIGFCGAPWTVATYMIGGRGSPDQAAAKLFALREPVAMARLIDVLVAASADYLVAQLAAGADVVQIFESWAANLDETLFDTLVIEPNRRIVERVKAAVPGARVIGFPRGAAGLIGNYAARTGVDAIGLDSAMAVGFADQVLPAGLAVQGNLDPLRLVAGGAAMRERAEAIIAGLSGRPHIFNLGHGIVPETPVEHVAELIRLVKQG